MTVTNHAREEEHLLSLLDCVRVSAFSPGVLGQTGFEAATLIAEAARSAGADAIVAIDALAARSTARLGTTVQISDTGIRPGSGIGNCRIPITREKMGIPVIALGVPTVVDSATLVWDALGRAGIDHPSGELRQVLNNDRSFIVSPKESDVIAASVAGVSGASAVLMGGVVSYDNSVKENLLGVSRANLEQYGAVSEQVARQMAEGVRKACGTTYGVATTGIAGPTGGTPEKPVGTVWMAVATPTHTIAKVVVHGKVRAVNIERAATAAINMLRLELKNK